ncbi:MAG: hypothetical protein NTV30_11310 [Chloroflexi bacterium]|nr:hypothetical protein [Chloroflexota bacterium]
MNNCNTVDPTQKTNLKNTARILSLAGSIPMLLWVIISYYINKSTGFEMTVVMLNSIFVIIAIMAFFRPFMAGIFGLGLSLVYMIAMTRFFLHFPEYTGTEQIAAVIVTFLLILFMAGSILHIYLGRKSKQSL